MSDIDVKLLKLQMNSVSFIYLICYFDADWMFVAVWFKGLVAVCLVCVCVCDLYSGVSIVCPFRQWTRSQSEGQMSGQCFPSSSSSSLPSFPPSPLCLFSRQLLINSLQGISCSPPLLPPFLFEVERPISSFYKTWIIKFLNCAEYAN